MMKAKTQQQIKAKNIQKLKNNDKVPPQLRGFFWLGRCWTLSFVSTTTFSWGWTLSFTSTTTFNEGWMVSFVSTTTFNGGWMVSFTLTTTFNGVWTLSVIIIIKKVTFVKIYEFFWSDITRIPSSKNPHLKTEMRIFIIYRIESNIKIHLTGRI